MRIVKLAELLQQERGTLFSPCKPMDYQGLYVYLGINGDPARGFCCDELLGPRNWGGDDTDHVLRAHDDSSIELALDLEYTGAVTRYKEEDTFAIYSPEDQAAFIGRLVAAQQMRMENTTQTSEG